MRFFLPSRRDARFLPTSMQKIASHWRASSRWIGPIWVLWAGLFLAIASGCQSPPSGAAGTPGVNAGSQAASGPVHDLSEDEADGGHTLKRHVGRTDEQLRERLERERNISAASTYTDRETAERVVGTVLQREQPRIHRWLQRAEGHPNLVLDYDGDSAHPIGRTLRRGVEQTQPCAQAVVVLRWQEPGEYYVLTSYPECR